MNENEIRNIVEKVLNRYSAEVSNAPSGGIPLEVSARHVHLTRDAVETLFGRGATLGKVRDLSQPGEFLSDKRVKLVTQKGEYANVAVLGPERKSVQVELSATDCRALGIQAPVNLSGDLNGAADVLILGENGVLEAKGSVIIAKAHLHFTSADATKYGVCDRQSVGVKIHSARPVTLHDVVVRVRDNFRAAMHIDFDEANACLATPETEITIVK
ncbi:MAG: phosphate propanoyltransferase [Clostridia bacterium]|nr:phosphate propanoyltransferase [Clostridia bacterium]